MLIVKRPNHRPRLDPKCVRVVMSLRVHPSTRALVDAECKRTGKSRGLVVDALVKTLKGRTWL